MGSFTAVAGVRRQTSDHSPTPRFSTTRTRRAVPEPALNTNRSRVSWLTGKRRPSPPFTKPAPAPLRVLPSWVGPPPTSLCAFPVSAVFWSASLPLPDGHREENSEHRRLRACLQIPVWSSAFTRFRRCATSGPRKRGTPSPVPRGSRDFSNRLLGISTRGATSASPVSRQPSVPSRPRGRGRRCR